MVNTCFIWSIISIRRHFFFLFLLEWAVTTLYANVRQRGLETERVELKPVKADSYKDEYRRWQKNAEGEAAMKREGKEVYGWSIKAEVPEVKVLRLRQSVWRSQDFVLKYSLTSLTTAIYNSVPLLSIWLVLLFNFVFATWYVDEYWIITYLTGNKLKRKEIIMIPVNNDRGWV